MSSPRVSVLLPIHNCERYLDEALTSVLRQTFSDFEVLAFDDGSTDRSLAILRSHAEGDPRVIVRSASNRGIVPVLNDMITMARGEYLARMDADDVCMPERFARQLTYLDDNPDVVVVGTRCILIDAGGHPICVSRNEISHEDIDAAILMGFGALRGFSHPTVMMRCSAVKDVGGYDPRFPSAEDIDLFARLAEVGRLANLPEPLLQYRQHHASVGYSDHQRQAMSANFAIALARERRGLPPALPYSVPAKGSSRADAHRKWAWWALQSGHLYTARKHALIALRTRPLDRDNLLLLACVIRGH